MNRLGFQDMSREICEGGLGENLSHILEKSGKLYIDEIIKWAHIERNGASIIQLLE